MKNGLWRQRLLECIEQDGRGGRELSRAAGLGPNFVSQLKKSGKNTGLQSVIALCRALKVSPIEIITGEPMTPDAEELLTIFAELPDHQRRQFLEFVRSLAQEPANESTPPVDPQSTDNDKT